MIAARAINPRLVANDGTRGPANWLNLAATPTFATMALITGASGPMSQICASGPLASLSGMTLMYALMGVFHSPPWLRLILRLRRAGVSQIEFHERNVR